VLPLILWERVHSAWENRRCAQGTDILRDALCLLGARNQREYQWPLTSIFPKTHQLQGGDIGAGRAGCVPIEQSAPKDEGLQNAQWTLRPDICPTHFTRRNCTYDL